MKAVFMNIFNLLVVQSVQFYKNDFCSLSLNIRNPHSWFFSAASTKKLFVSLVLNTFFGWYYYPLEISLIIIDNTTGKTGKIQFTLETKLDPISRETGLFMEKCDKTVLVSSRSSSVRV